MTDETISVGETLDLTYYITEDEETVSNASEVEFTTGEPSENDLLNYTEGLQWTPKEPGEYIIEVGGNQELSIQVTDTPDSEGYLYNESEHEDFWQEGFTQEDGQVTFEGEYIRAFCSDPGSSAQADCTGEINFSNYDTIEVDWSLEENFGETINVGILSELGESRSDAIWTGSEIQDEFNRRVDTFDISGVNESGFAMCYVRQRSGSSSGTVVGRVWKYRLLE